MDAPLCIRGWIFVLKTKMVQSINIIYSKENFLPETYRVVDFRIVAPHILKVIFDDYQSQIIDFSPVLFGKLYGPLQDISFFESVKIDYETHTLVWANGADFDSATLHDWDIHASRMW